MEKKYIVELYDENVKSVDGYNWLKLLISVADKPVMVETAIELLPYTEPDTEKVRKEAYQQGLSDAKEGKATCQYCEYQYLDDTEEPCKKCCKAYMNKFKPKAKEQQIQVGDEVKCIKANWTAIVTKIEEGSLTLMDDSGAIADGYEITKFVKTERHFPEIAAVLAKMKEKS